MRNHALGIKLISCFQKHTVASSKIVALGLAKTDWLTQMGLLLASHALHVLSSKWKFLNLLSNKHVLIYHSAGLKL